MSDCKRCNNTGTVGDASSFTLTGCPECDTLQRIQKLAALAKDILANPNRRLVAITMGDYDGYCIHGLVLTDWAKEKLEEVVRKFFLNSRGYGDVIPRHPSDLITMFADRASYYTAVETWNAHLKTWQATNGSDPIEHLRMVHGLTVITWDEEVNCG